MEEGKEEEQRERVKEEEVVKEGVASIALLPSGSISGHFIQLPDSICYGLHGIGYNIVLEAVQLVEGLGSGGLLPRSLVRSAKKNFDVSRVMGCRSALPIWFLAGEVLRAELACERECSRGEDYRLIKLTIIDYNKKKEQDVVVECRGHDAARFNNINHAHGWEKDVAGMVEQKHEKNKISVSFECETLKADKAAEDHIKQFMPKLAGLDAVVNIGKMRITGLDTEAEEDL